MLEILGDRQKELLKLLLKDKAGLTAGEISAKLGIAKNAVRQHIAALQADELIALGETRPSGGRPQQLYILTEKGKECFPRHYSWFAELLIEMIQEKLGTAHVKEQLTEMGTRVGMRLKIQTTQSANPQEIVQNLASSMEDLGYHASSHVENGSMIIEAKNCVFHHLAMKNSDICQFDLALMATFTDAKVEHQQCMAKKDCACRFKFEFKD